MLNKKSVDDINVKGQRVLVRCDFNVPLQDGKITDENRLVAALPTIKKLIADGGKVILCSHLGKVKNGPNEGESLAPVAKRLEELLGQKVNFVSDYNVTGEAATKAVEEMKEGEVVLLQNTRFRGAEETKNGEQFSKELADLADIYVCDAFGSSHRAHASVAGVTKFITAKGAGCRGMVAGQVADIEGEGTHCSKELLEYIHINKTAALLVSTIRAGAYLGGADAKTLVDLTTYGEQLGLLFQITDDILDACGDEDEMGKKTGVDVAKNKVTYVSLYGIEKAKQMAQDLAEDAKKSIACYYDNAEVFNDIIDDVLTRTK